MTTDHELARTLASTAGEFLVDYQRDGLAADRWGEWLGADGDAAAHDVIIEQLHSARPDDAWLSEEGRDDPEERSMSERAWVIDPLDGSADFGRGTNEWAVHVALTERGSATAGAVAVPGLGRVFSTDEATAVGSRTDRAPVVVTGRARHWTDGQRVAGALSGELVVCGSAGVKAMLVVAGVADIYVHAGALYEWDVCAPAIVAQAHGLVAVAPDGAELRFNKSRPVVPGVVITHPDLLDATLAALH